MTSSTTRTNKFVRGTRARQTTCLPPAGKQQEASVAPRLDKQICQRQAMPMEFRDGLDEFLPWRWVGADNKTSPDAS
jgi:hypothetical protein